MSWGGLRRDPAQWMHQDDRKTDEEWRREEEQYQEYLRDAEPSPSFFFPPYKDPKS